MRFRLESSNYLTKIKLLDRKPTSTADMSEEPGVRLNTLKYNLDSLGSTNGKDAVSDFSGIYYEPEV